MERAAATVARLCEGGTHSGVHDARSRDEFERASSRGVFTVGDDNPQRDFEYDRRDIRDGINALESLIDRLDLISDPAAVTPTRPEVSLASRDIFVVHGRDEGLREAVARVLNQLGFNPVILSEKPNQGHTLIEKFEANALDVGFAVVILSPDDYARGPDEVEFPTSPNRARQNVILELGYFMGSLGQGRVCALSRAGTKTPSDIHGLAYIAIDPAGAWRSSLGTELHAAGYSVDLNRLRSNKPGGEPNAGGRHAEVGADQENFPRSRRPRSRRTSRRLDYSVV